MGSTTNKEREGSKEVALRKGYKHGCVKDLNGKKVNITLTARIDEGAYGVVFRGNTSSGETLAVKCLKIESSVKSRLRNLVPYRYGSPTASCATSSLNRIKEEIKAWKCLTSEFVVRFVGQEQYFFDYWVAMEICLYSCDYILQFDNIYFRTPMTLYLYVPILSALQELHEKGFVHRDIKPDNILINSRGIPKLCDFGLTISLSSDKYKSDLLSSDPVGTSYYVAPEIVQKVEYDGRVDVFALGLVIISGRWQKPIKDLFPDTTTQELYLLYKLQTDDSYYQLENYIKPALVDDPVQSSEIWRDAIPVLKRMTDLSHTQRISATDALDDPAFFDVMKDWKAWLSKEPVSVEFKFYLSCIGRMMGVDAEPDFKTFAESIPRDLVNPKK